MPERVKSIDAGPQWLTQAFFASAQITWAENNKRQLSMHVQQRRQ
jgi:hypothetical protein